MPSESVSKPSVAVAIPAYNEADGIAGFLEEIDRALEPHVGSLRMIVVDDASSDTTREVLESVRSRLRGRLEVLVNGSNRGHGPTVLAAYRQALEIEPDLVLQVDGDGQFHGSDLRRVLVLLLDQAHAVSGVRRFRQDPWFRMAGTTWDGSRAIRRRWRGRWCPGRSASGSPNGSGRPTSATGWAYSLGHRRAPRRRAGRSPRRQSRRGA